VRKADNLPPSCAVVTKSGNLNFLEPCGPLQACYWTAFFLCDIPQNKAPRTAPHHIWHTYRLCAFFGHEKNTDGSGVGLKVSLASACYGNSRVAQHLLQLHLVFQQNWGWGSLGSFWLTQLNSSPEGA